MTDGRKSKKTIGGFHWDEENLGVDWGPNKMKEAISILDLS